MFSKLAMAIMLILLVNSLGVGQESLDITRDLLNIDVSDYDRSHAIQLISRHDQNRDRSLNEEEMRTLKLMMPVTVIDFNRNRRLTTLEIAIYFANASDQLNISTLENYNARYLVNRHDRDADGALAQREQSEFPLQDEAKQIDRDANGVLTAFELAMWFANTYTETGVDARDFRLAADYLNNLDSDKNLSLNEEEAVPGIWPIDPWSQDANRNHELEAVEIAAVFGKFKQDAGIENGHELGAERAMARYDKDRNGRLDLGEIERGRWPKEWETFDANEDGFLTAFELAARFAAKQRTLGVDRRTIDKAEALIRSYDRNRNGQVDMQEMLEFRADVGAIDTDTFLRLDTDGNQKLTKVELAVYFVTGSSGGN
ncbi:MAG: EF-hand domain-containing protein [Planctomycetes bacterium]|nr:EF-hand domain-containing protein [Planctomycetota bacterium]